MPYWSYPAKRTATAFRNVSGLAYIFYVSTTN